MTFLTHTIGVELWCIVGALVYRHRTYSSLDNVHLAVPSLESIFLLLLHLLVTSTLPFPLLNQSSLLLLHLFVPTSAYPVARMESTRYAKSKQDVIKVICYVFRKNSQRTALRPLKLANCNGGSKTTGRKPTDVSPGLALLNSHLAHTSRHDQ